jgi:hypothetical protein
MPIAGLSSKKNDFRPSDGFCFMGKMKIDHANYTVFRQTQIGKPWDEGHHHHFPY